METNDKPAHPLQLHGMNNLTSRLGYVAAGTVPPLQSSSTKVSMEPTSSSEGFMPIYQSPRRHISCHWRHCENIRSLTTWARSPCL